MLTVRDVKVPLDKYDRLLECCAEQLKTGSDNIKSFRILKKSLDARKRSELHFVYTFEVELKHNENEIVRRCPKAEITAVEKEESFQPVRDAKRPPVLIVGSGPAGLFCALEMIKYGYAPVIIERGRSVDERVGDVDKFNLTGVLDTESNIQFGEGGAGTFSDGKLNTGVNSSHRKAILETFVRFGADESILYDAQPHIGTDVLRVIVKNIRDFVINHGGSYLFGTKLTSFRQNENGIVSAEVTRNGTKSIIDCDTIVLAIGHSARDTFEMLDAANVPMCQKPFAVGARIEHLQETINKGRYGSFYDHPALSAANYKLTAQLENGSLFTFCMCPGGTVVAAASNNGEIVTNGMSNKARDSVNANSALLVGVSAADFGSDDVFAGVRYQQQIEHSAFLYSGSFKAPCQRVGDFLADMKTVEFGNVLPSYSAGAVMGKVNCCLPERVTSIMRFGLFRMGRMLPGFDAPDALLTAPETRSSSPVRILRGEDKQSPIKGLYPCGEGAGYAGGITSAAIDGILVARSIMSKR